MTQTVHSGDPTEGDVTRLAFGVEDSEQIVSEQIQRLN
jgi:hypothetical protein